MVKFVGPCSTTGSGIPLHFLFYDFMLDSSVNFRFSPFFFFFPFLCFHQLTCSTLFPGFPSSFPHFSSFFYVFLFVNIFVALSPLQKYLFGQFFIGLLKKFVAFFVLLPLVYSTTPRPRRPLVSLSNFVVV